MYHMVRSLGVKAVLRRELPAGAAAFLIGKETGRGHEAR